MGNNFLKSLDLADGHDPIDEAIAHKIWDYYDINGDGFLSHSECAGFISDYAKANKLPKTKEHEILRQFFLRYDNDMDGRISWEEVLEIDKLREEKAARKAAREAKRKKKEQQRPKQVAGTSPSPPAEVKTKKRPVADVVPPAPASSSKHKEAVPTPINDHAHRLPPPLPDSGTPPAEADLPARVGCKRPAMTPSGTCDKPTEDASDFCFSHHCPHCPRGKSSSKLACAQCTGVEKNADVQPAAAATAPPGVEKNEDVQPAAAAAAPPGCSRPALTDSGLCGRAVAGGDYCTAHLCPKCQEGKSSSKPTCVNCWEDPHTAPTASPAKDDVPTGATPSPVQEQPRCEYVNNGETKSEDEVRRVWNAFVSCDTDKSGDISLEELGPLMRIFGAKDLNPDVLKKAMVLGDKDADGALVFDEFVFILGWQRAQCKVSTCSVRSSSKGLFCKAHICPTCCAEKDSAHATCSSCAPATTCMHVNCVAIPGPGGMCPNHTCPACGKDKSSALPSCVTCDPELEGSCRHYGCNSEASGASILCSTHQCPRCGKDKSSLLDECLTCVPRCVHNRSTNCPLTPVPNARYCKNHCCPKCSKDKSSLSQMCRGCEA